MKILRTSAALAVLLAAASPAAAQTVIPGFARSDQSDASGVSLTSADLLGFEPGTIKSFSCPVAWAVRTTSDDLRTQLSVAGTRADLLELLDDGPGARQAGERLVQALSRNNTGAAARAARGLPARLRGLLAASSRMNPASPGEIAATRLNASVTQFNRFVDASSPEFAASPPPEMLQLRSVLGALVEAAAAHENRIADPNAPVAAGALACAPPPVVVVPPPPPPPPPAELRLCVIHEGAVREVVGRIDPATGDTTINGTPFAAAFPGIQYAAGREFYAADQPVTFNGRRYVRFMLPRVLNPGDVTQAGEYQGVPVFVEPGAGATPQVLYLPVRECEFQPYQLETKTGGVRG